MRILIAEDDQVLADGLLRSLRGTGYAVDQVGTGSEADAALAAHEFDLVILDLGLPKLHGLEVLRRMRARGCATPVLILTAADSVEQRSRAWTWAPTTSWPSPSRCRSSRRACGPSRGAAWARPPA
jgi:DNA-binding response OmpR family regulator